MDPIIGLKDLRENFADYAAQVQDGQSFVVVKRSKPLFRITPIERDSWERVVDFTKVQKGGVPVDDILSRL